MQLKQFLSKLFNGNPKCPVRLACKLSQEIAKTNPDTPKALELISAGACMKSVNDYFGSPLLVRAAQQGHTDIFIAMVNKGAKLNARNIRRQDALIVAVIHGQTDIVKFIASQEGAVLDRKDMYGMTALDYARNGHKDEIAAILESTKTSRSPATFKLA